MMLAVALLLAQAGEQAGDRAAQAEPVKEKKICRSEDMTGSRLRATKICRTASEWRELDESARRDVDAARARSRPNG